MPVSLFGETPLGLWQLKPPPKLATLLVRSGRAIGCAGGRNAARGSEQILARSETVPSAIACAHAPAVRPHP